MEMAYMRILSPQLGLTDWLTDKEPLKSAVD